MKVLVPECRSIWLVSEGNPITDTTRFSFELVTMTADIVRDGVPVRLWMNPLLLPKKTSMPVRYNGRKYNVPIRRTVYNNIRQVSIQMEEE